MKRSSLQSLFSDESRSQAEAQRAEAKRVRQEEEECQRARLEEREAAVIESVTLKHPLQPEGGVAKAARKLNRLGLLVLRGRKRHSLLSCSGLDSLAAECLDLERRVTLRLRHLGVQFSDFDNQSKQACRALDECLAALAQQRGGASGQPGHCDFQTMR